MKKAASIHKHRAPSPTPVRLRRGDHLTSCEARATTWKGWVWCRTADGSEGWVPKSYVSFEQGSPVMICDYDATELEIDEGESVTIIATESGWALCEKTDGTQGWLPIEVLENNADDCVEVCMTEEKKHEREISHDVVMAQLRNLVDPLFMSTEVLQHVEQYFPPDDINDRVGKGTLTRNDISGFVIRFATTLREQVKAAGRAEITNEDIDAAFKKVKHTRPF